MKKKKKKEKSFLIVYLLISAILVFIYFCVSYYGFFIFCEGFNELDYLFFNIIGDAILVGITTYISTKSISLFLSKKEFERNSKLVINIFEKSHSLYNFRTFLDNYSNSNFYFVLSESDKKIVNYVYKKYQLFESVLNKAYESDDALKNILNLPFTAQFISGDFKKNWKDLIKNTCKGKSKNNINLFKTLICEDDYEIFERFSLIMMRIKFFEISNVCQNGCTLLICIGNNIISKFSCLSNNLYGVYMYFDAETKIKFTGFSYDYNNKKIAVDLLNCKYCNNVEEVANITLEDYIGKEK